MALALKNINVKARSFLGWQVPILTNNSYGKAKILDIDSKDPIIGANVQLGKEGAATDKLGMFSIKTDFNKEYKLKISHIAYIDLEYKTIVPCNLYGRYDNYNPRI